MLVYTYTAKGNKITSPAFSAYGEVVFVICSSQNGISAEITRDTAQDSARSERPVAEATVYPRWYWHSVHPWSTLENARISG